MSSDGTGSGKATGTEAGTALGRLPIVIGVTGHRGLPAEALPHYRRRVAELLADFRTRYPSTPIRVLSPLAAGADRLVAQVALDSGCELVVPLPFAPADYERDFPDSVAEFRGILERVPENHVFVLPRAAGDDGKTPEAAADRDAQYRRVGAYIASHSHVLVALWDGLPPASDAGTGAIVQLKLEGAGGGYPASVLDPEDSGPVYHLHAPRTGQGLDATWLFPEDADGRAFTAVARAIERFNAEPLPAGAATGAGSLVPDLSSRTPDDRAVAAAFARADALALRYQRATHRVIRATLALAACLAIVFEVYAHVVQWRVLPIAYLGVFAAITALYAWQRRIEAQSRYLDYRALAEGLRVQFYWRLAGLHDAVAASYLRRQLDELRWIREALRGAAAVPPAGTPRIDLALTHWVREQREYYLARTISRRHRFHVVERWSWFCFGSGLFATSALVVAWAPITAAHTLHHALVLLMGFAPVGAALAEAFSEKFALRAQANQFARFAAIFGRAEAFLVKVAASGADAGQEASVRDVLRALGREALMENGDWVLLFRDRPIVLPKGA